MAIHGPIIWCMSSLLPDLTSEWHQILSACLLNTHECVSSFMFASFLVPGCSGRVRGGGDYDPSAWLWGPASKRGKYIDAARWQLNIGKGSADAWWRGLFEVAEDFTKKIVLCGNKYWLCNRTNVSWAPMTIVVRAPLNPKSSSSSPNVSLMLIKRAFRKARI